MMFLDCPAYLDDEGATRCGLPAEVEDRHTMRSTDGPVESVKIRCPSGHFFNAPLDVLVVPSPHGDRQPHEPPAPARYRALRQP
ncbi:MAG TPA: hypothetical protein VKG80_10155 [Trebonia sp.]|nr:hypothetical protein [Trebonia sp.]